MDIKDLAGQMSEQHRETQARLIKLDKDVTDVRENVIRIENTMQTKETCEERRSKMHDKINKKHIANKVMAFLGGVVGGIIAVLTFGVLKGGK